MAEEFRLPGSSYEELVNIVVAYGTRDEASNPGDVGKLASVQQSSVSRSNAFLKAIGVLQGESTKLVTRRGRILARALARGDRAEIRTRWREIVSTSEFLQNVVSAVKLREGMLYETLQAYVAHSAGQPRNKPVMTGAGAIIEILKTAGLLEEEAGELTATFDEEPGDIPLDEAREYREPSSPNGLSLSLEGSPNTAPGTGPAINIHLHVRCSADEIEDLAPRLKALLRELSEPGP
ncbi:MAG: hypothetical protein ACR2HO_02275 [Rubrobacteraceae bacterium]|nr:hypothetical protein [Rubrobacter sp.]